MSFALADESKERVRQATDVVDLIGGYIQLRRAGRAFEGLCPFHADRKPSLKVNPERQSWRCFVCNIGGDVFDFVMKRDSIGFREALEMLADRAGISIAASPAGQTSKSDERKAIFAALAWAEKQYRECLENQSASGPGRSYFDQRQISAESRARFHLGYAPNEWQWLTDRAVAAGIAPETLSAAGLIGRNEQSGRWYDRFRGRVMFPIRDARQRPIAFGGRILPQFADEKTGKYYNSPETALFHKSREVYGLDVASGEIIKSSRTAVLVEGYTDVIMAHQHGMGNVVAVLGTAVTAEHVQQRSVLRRYADTIVLLLDGDAAGQNRAAGLVELFVTEDADLRIASLSGGLDPCDFLLQKGVNALREIVSGSVDALEHRIRTAQEGLDLTKDTFAAAKALESILGALAKAPQSRPGDVSAAARLREQQVLARLARQFQVEEETLRARLAELRKSAGGIRRKTDAAPIRASAPARPRKELPAEGEGVGLSDFDLAGEACEVVGFEQTGVVDSAPVQADEEAPITASGLKAADAEFLEILTQYPLLAGAALGRVELELLSPGPARVIYLTYHRIVQSGETPELPLVMSALEDLRLKALLVELDERASAKNERAMSSAEERLEELAATFERCRQRSEYQVKSAVLHSADTEATKKTELFLQLLTQKRRSNAAEPST